MKTFDGKKVKVGDKVYVLGSCGIYSAKVLPPVTSYVLFGNIEVSNSFSTKELAEEYKYNSRKNSKN